MFCYPFNKNCLEVINKIRKIVDYGKIDKMTLFRNDLYILIVAGEIIGYDRKEITKLYANLSIKSSKDLKITSEEILKILQPF